MKIAVCSRHRHAMNTHVFQGKNVLPMPMPCLYFKWNAGEDEKQAVKHHETSEMRLGVCIAITASVLFMTAAFIENNFLFKRCVTEQARPSGIALGASKIPRRSGAKRGWAVFSIFQGRRRQIHFKNRHPSAFAGGYSCFQWSRWLETRSI